MSPFRKVKIYNHKERKEFSQRTQKFELHSSIFEYFVYFFVNFVVKNSFRSGRNNRITE